MKLFFLKKENRKIDLQEIIKMTHCQPTQINC